MIMPTEPVPLDEAYFVWLYSQVGSVKLKNRAKSYWKLLRLLHQREFTWSNVEMDANRAQEGKDLRLQFFRETGIESDDSGWMDLPCSFLELLVALAWAVAFEGGGTQQDRFWELINNLGLTECTDAYPPEERILDRILDKVIDRSYGPSGVGGLFPLSNPTQDQRDVELWYQANAYLLEQLDRV
jgi:hypothetical protein